MATVARREGAVIHDATNYWVSGVGGLPVYVINREVVTVVKSDPCPAALRATAEVACAGVGAIGGAFVGCVAFFVGSDYLPRLENDTHIKLFRTTMIAGAAGGAWLGKKTAAYAIDFIFGREHERTE